MVHRGLAGCHIYYMATATQYRLGCQQTGAAGHSVKSQGSGLYSPSLGSTTAARTAAETTAGTSQDTHTAEPPNICHITFRVTHTPSNRSQLSNRDVHKSEENLEKKTPKRKNPQLTLIVYFC